MLRRIRKLLSHPGFKAEPLTVLCRGAVWAANVALKRSPVFSLTAAGEKVQVPADLRYTSVMTYLMRDWTEPEMRQLDRFLGAGDVFIDVGANIGLFTVKAARLVGPGGRVVAVEPGAEAAARLEHNIALNGYSHAQVVQKAIADKIGTATLHHIPTGNDPQAFSLLSDGTDLPAETVETTTLDALVGEAGLARVDVLKIDVEGAEPLVIAGAGETLQRFRPLVIFEANTTRLDPEGRSTTQSWAALAGHGYGFYRLVSGRLMPLSAPPVEFCNIVAVHPENARALG